MARSFRSNRTIISHKRRVGWDTGPQMDSTSLSTATPVIWTTGSIVLVDGVTLVRTRGLITFRTSAVDAVTSGMSGAWGLAIASENAFGVGLSALMNPFDDSGWDGWLAHGFWDVGTEVGGEGGTQRIEIDSKAMRKLKATDVIYGTVDVASETGTVVTGVTANTRMLFKLA